MSRLTNDEFFIQLARLFDSRKGKHEGQVVLSQKRFSPANATPEAPLDDLHPPRPLPILVRATDANDKAARKDHRKVRLSTVVEPEQLPAFYDRYADVCKLGMAALKPRDRSKRKGKANKKKKATA
ncbi:signal recognition particle 14kD protein [Xylariaceae sp. FL0255]|nr:signal recognition particle 14kD protein [Xylariaceae sp. FL0255]